MTSLQNNGGVFTDVTNSAGIYSSLIGFGLGVTLGDINKDGYIDIYVSNDFYERDYFYINQGDGTFKEEDIQNILNHISHSSMGADMADINNDGFAEIFVTDMLPREDTRLKETTEFEGFDIYRIKQEKAFYHQFMQNTLQFNNQNNTFSEISTIAGGKPPIGVGALIWDMDNDGQKDLFVCNGIYHELTNQDFVNYFANEVVQRMALTGEKEDVINIIEKMPKRPLRNLAFRNDAEQGFKNMSVDWGFDQKTFSNGAAYGDLDNDGDLDLIINNVNQPVMLYQNKATEKGANYLQFQLSGDENNTFAIGSKINVYTNGKVLFSEVIPTRGFQSSVDVVTTIGLGKTTQVDSVQVIWPNNKQTVLKDVPVNQRLHLSIAEATQPVKKPTQKLPSATLDPVVQDLGHT